VVSSRGCLGTVVSSRGCLGTVVNSSAQLGALVVEPFGGYQIYEIGLAECCTPFRPVPRARSCASMATGRFVMPVTHRTRRLGRTLGFRLSPSQNVDSTRQGLADAVGDLSTRTEDHRRRIVVGSAARRTSSRWRRRCAEVPVGGAVPAGATSADRESGRPTNGVALDLCVAW
jgi:hypothetical protein